MVNFMRQLECFRMRILIKYWAKLGNWVKQFILHNEGGVVLNSVWGGTDQHGESREQGMHGS